MSNLSCTVDSCANYCHGLCALSSVHVSGTNAVSSAQTACASYRRSASMTNRAGDQTASAATSIDCKACNCVHNSHCRCNAETVSIDNCATDSGAGCKTFKE